MLCFSKDKHNVIGVDVDRTKVDLVNQGKSTIIEEGLEEQIKASVDNGLLKATQDYKAAVNDSDISFVCVGTPSLPNGSINLGYIYEVVKQIAEVIKQKKSFHTVVIRSTVKVGTLRACQEIIEDISGKNPRCRLWCSLQSGVS